MRAERRTAQKCECDTVSFIAGIHLPLVVLRRGRYDGRDGETEIEVCVVQAWPRGSVALGE